MYLVISALLITAQNHHWEALFRLAKATRAHQIELTGLKWTDIYQVRKVLNIGHQFERPDRNGD